MTKPRSSTPLSSTLLGRPPPPGWSWPHSHRWVKSGRQWARLNHLLFHTSCVPRLQPALVCLFVCLFVFLFLFLFFSPTCFLINTWMRALEWNYLVPGFHTGGGGGGWNFPLPATIFPPPRNLEIEIALSQVLNNNLVPDCVRSNLRGPKIQFFSGGGGEGGGGGGGGMPPDPLVGAHAYACVSMLSHSTTILFPPQLKILYETLYTVCCFYLLCRRNFILKS